MDAASMNRSPCLAQQARSFVVKCRFSRTTFASADGERDRRINRFTFAESGLAFAGFLDMYIFKPPRKNSVR